jgi:RNA ligase
MCRGLITDLEGNIICRPFPKFFNLSQHDGDKLPLVNWQQEFVCTRKWDGSLGILYPTSEGYRIATRGSFTSDQAERANALLEALSIDPRVILSDHTYLFEIIYPENRIVIDYGQQECLVLLEIIENSTGRGLPCEIVEVTAKELSCQPTVRYDWATAERLQAFADEEAANDEGVVVRFADGLRVKVKHAEYVRLHWLLTCITSRTIWRALKDGTGIESYVEQVPDEFHAWVRSIDTGLREKFAECESQARTILEGIVAEGVCTTRKDYAARFMAHKPYTPILFKMLDQRAYSDMIWAMIEPDETRPFKTDTEL